MTLTLELLPETQRRLETLAMRKGQDVPGFVQRLIEEAAKDILVTPLPGEKTFDSILAPFRQGFDESDLNEEDMMALFDAELKAVRAERKAKREAHG